MPEEIGSAIPGGVIAYISSGSASSPESCMSGSSNGGYLSSSPPRHSLPSRAVGMVVDIAPPAKHQRGHGTEKAGRSTSSAKSNLTKINGMVLLCKVCGDVASGFHYGVHACEGCKGFFRRSIQQNIQYKKCLKMDSCTIMRINRNRCQQCRFKKCLAVGMSRDAVRFGRIPKREKQRMLLEMQNAMNNMMSNNSQLHSMLQGSQSPPLNNGVCPSSSSSASSSSCSNPASPQDSESVVSMDTNSSSASSCSSDSGEDEASSRQDPMAFQQQPRSTRQPAGPPLPVGRESGNNGHMEEERRESWNRWNDSVAIGSHQHAHYHSHQATSNSAYRAGSVVYQRAPQQSHGSDGAMSEHSQSHHQQWEQQRGMQAFSNHYSGPAYNNFAAHTNAPTYMGAQKANQEIWEEFSMSFAPAVREVVEFAKRIPGFRDLSEHDQVSLLKAGTFEVLMVRFTSLFDKAERTVTFRSGKRYSLEALRSCGAGDLLTAMCEFSEKLAMLQLDQDEMSLFTAVVLVSADRTSIHNLSSVETLQDKLIQALRNLINKNHASEAATFTKLLLKLPELRSLNNMHSEELLAFTVHP